MLGTYQKPSGHGFTDGLTAHKKEGPCTRPSAFPLGGCHVANRHGDRRQQPQHGSRAKPIVVRRRIRRQGGSQWIGHHVGHMALWGQRGHGRCQSIASQRSRPQEQNDKISRHEGHQQSIQGSHHACQNQSRRQQDGRFIHNQRGGIRSSFRFRFFLGRGGSS